MSKEWLEKAKKILNHIKGYGVYDGNDDIEIFEWLIEQAERVQELESFKNSVEYTVDSETLELIINNQDNDKVLSLSETYDEKIYLLQKRVQELEDAVESYKKTSRHANISHKMAEEQNKRYEEELERRNGVHQENIYRMGEEMKAVEKINKLEEQNKLYRQLLEEVIEEGSSFMVDLIADVLYSDDHNDRMSK